MKTDFYLRRLHSLLGLIPLLIFVPVHMLQKGMPFLTFNFKDGFPFFLVLFGIAPFVLHALLGVYIYIQNRISPVKKHPGRLFRLQIVSSIIILIFVPLHIYIFWILENAATYTAFIISIIVFVLGITAFAFHIGYGAFTACITWGICASTRSRRRTRVITSVLGAAFGIGGIVFYTLVFIGVKGMLSL